MEGIQLDEYIRHGMILKNIAHMENTSVDAVIFESFDNPHINIPEHIIVHTLDTIQRDSIVAQIIAYTQQYDSILVVLDSLLLEDITPYMRYIADKITQDPNFAVEKKIHLINLCSGLSGIFHKGNADMYDTSIAHTYAIPTYEPYDFVSLFHCIENSATPLQYIRLTHARYPWNLFQQNTPNLSHVLIDMSTYGIAWNDATVFCPWAHIHSYIQPDQSNKTYAYDLFMLYGYTLDTLDEKIKTACITSIQKTGKVIVILDQHTWCFYEIYFSDRLTTLIPEKTYSFTCIYPCYTSILPHEPETLYQKASFTAESITYT